MNKCFQKKTPAPTPTPTSPLLLSPSTLPSVSSPPTDFTWRGISECCKVCDQECVDGSMWGEVLDVTREGGVGQGLREGSKIELSDCQDHYKAGRQHQQYALLHLLHNNKTIIHIWKQCIHLHNPT